MTSKKPAVASAHKHMYPVLALKDIVVFPYMIVPLFVGRKKSVSALEAIMVDNMPHQKIILVSQKSSQIEDPDPQDLFHIGTLVNVLQLLKLPDGSIKILVEGESRFEITDLESLPTTSGRNKHYQGTGRIIETPYDPNIHNITELEALKATMLEHIEQYMKMNRRIPHDLLGLVSQVDDYSRFADTLASYFALKMEQRLELLETCDIQARMHKLIGFIGSELEMMNIQQKIKVRVKGQIDKSQKDYYLSEQLKAIYQEMNTAEDGGDEGSALEQKIKENGLPKEAAEKALGEIRKLRTMNPTSSEAVVVRNYLDWLVNLPWATYSKLQMDLEFAEKTLNDNHYSLEKIKERIVEFLAVQNRTQKVSGPILCLMGPPGVGKTSLGQSIAKATGREFYRISLGGVRDEAEIRGHRRTYIGSLPGKILHAIRRCGTNNPLILLDEVDKISNDWRGDPSSALLEVLDPEQNMAFHDHYLEVDYDLSNVLFIATANSYNMPAPLVDRFEIIELSGYTEDEKKQIAIQHLIPKQEKAHALSAAEIDFEPTAVTELIRYYTREAGVRNLERAIAKICRKSVVDLMRKKIEKQKVTVAEVNSYCGPRKFSYGVTHTENMIGVVNGLAWTEAGGDLLKVEAVVLPGSGRTQFTGKLGDVMKESIETAISLVRARADSLEITDQFWKEKDIHIHVPEGATPKDGPSAGVAMAVAIVSALTGKHIRNDVAMTGEITLVGQVLKIGGLKEKILAAHRAGISTVLIPDDNVNNLIDIPKNVLDQLTIVPLKTIDQALAVVFS